MHLTRRAAPDRNLLVGMSLLFPRMDLEPAVALLAEYGFQGVEVYFGQLAPSEPRPPTHEGHATAAAEMIRRAGLTVSSLNVVGDRGFDPHTGTESRRKSIDTLAYHLRMGAAMGAPRVLIWEGIVNDADENAATVLGEVIVEAEARSGLAQAPRVTVEPHPYTFGLSSGRLVELANALVQADASICLDLCHFAVARGADFIDSLEEEVLDAVDHVHLSDSDARSSELHFPPGMGVLDLDRVGRRLQGRGFTCAWDLFGWPAPRAALENAMPAYARFVEQYAAGLPESG
jgi:sugar phosphate isomerase/epimerase